MIRVASLFLPQLAIERLRRAERHPPRSGASPEAARPAPRPVLRPPAARFDLPPCDDQPGVCPVPRGGGWRPGARWARAASEAAAPDWRGADAGAARARPMILVARTGQRDTVTAACPAALDLGIAPGMAAAHARALVADLDVRDANRDADRAWLDRLALHAARHWTPSAAVAGEDGLWLDIGGTAHLFGGEARFSARLCRFLARLGFTARIAVAGTPGAAHALARFGGAPIRLLSAGEEAEALAPLPLAALRLAPGALAAARRFGLERVGDLYPMPRGPLARRLGRGAVERLDQARGFAPEPFAPVVPFETPEARRQLLEPIGTAEAIGAVIDDLLRDLLAELERQGLGLRLALLRCATLDRGEQRVTIGAARATRDAAHLRRLFGLRIDRIEPGLGIEAMMLAALEVEPLAPAMIDAALDGRAQGRDLAPLVDQLAGRAGEAALFRLASVESDVPERAVARAAPLASPPGWPAWPRPVRILSRPEPLQGVMALLPDHPPRRFAWRGRTYRIVAGDGPERIHGEWWRRPREMWAVRDYFRVEADTGERFWLFRRGDGLDEQSGDLSWFMHGVFG
ncbi:DNA polymerase Y family protein [Sphingopyxis flava]|uniref:DNA polymerase Y family protein n=1 Tax=Sphingopyxis flava TaxID=1507287 RepID=UPI001FEBA329|nr:DNA polymerase Y family protein [Sphingopyxis flava]